MFQNKNKITILGALAVTALMNFPQLSGNSTFSLEEASTNIENGFGIFTGASSDTLYLEVVKL